MVEQFGTSGVPIPCRTKPTYGGTLVFSCATIIQIHHLSVKFLNVSLYSEFQRAVFNGIEKRSLYWLGHLGAIYQRVLENIFIYLQKKHSHSYLAQKNFLSGGSRWERHFVHSPSQMVAAESKFFMRASAAVLQNNPPSGSRREGIFRTTLMKKCRKIMLPKLDRIFKMNFPTTCRE